MPMRDMILTFIHTPDCLKMIKKFKYGEEWRTCNGETEIISIVAVLFRIYWVSVDLSDAVFLHHVGGQHLVAHSARDPLRQLDETDAPHRRHTTAKFDVATNWYQSWVDAETGYDALLHIATCRVITCPLACPGVTHNFIHQ